MTTVCIDPQRFLHQFKVGEEFEQLFGGFQFCNFEVDIS